LVSIPGLHKEAAKSFSDKQKADFDLWKAWKEGGENPNEFRPLLHKFRGMIRKRANRWANQADLPQATVFAEFNKQFLHAAKTYNPNKGAGLGTWVDNNLRKAQRWVATYQDPTRVQEQRYYKIGEFQGAVSHLDDVKGREPSTRELAEHLGWTEKEVGRMQSELRGSLFSSGFEYDPTTILPSREAEVLRFVRYQLGNEELQVYDYTTGAFGKPQLKPGEIAKKLKMSPSKVSRIRNKITGIIEDYMKK
jgi:DNA-directed RNA polymerase specialized sigma subunit